MVPIPLYIHFLVIEIVAQKAYSDCEFYTADGINSKFLLG
jgi:hypothetical protein